MSDIKMSDEFDLPVTILERGDRDYYMADTKDVEEDSISGVFFHELTASSVVIAINTYDDNQTKIAQQQARIAELKQLLADAHEWLDDNPHYLESKTHDKTVVALSVFDELPVKVSG